MKRFGHRMRIAIIGLGQFGNQLAQNLAKQADVLAIDSSQALVDSIADRVQQARCLNAADFDSLHAIITDSFDDVIVSMGESMESSILCTLHLKKIGVKSIRCKAINKDHAAILSSIGATEIIFPERETADRVSRHILNPNLLDFVPLEEGYQVVDMAAPQHFQGKSLIELELRKRFDVFVLGIRQTDLNNFLFLPGPQYTIRPDDVLMLIGKEDGLVKIGNGEKK
jgi:trk system potassium uptake protein TrkA